MTRTRGTRPFHDLVGPSSTYFTGPTSVRRTVYQCYTRAGRPMPRAHKRVMHYVFRDLTLHCHRMLSGLHGLSPVPVRALRMVNKKDQGRLLGRFATGTVKVPIVTNPSRTATVKGIVVRTVATNRTRSVGKVQRLVRGSVPLGACGPRGSRG